RDILERIVVDLGRLPEVGAPAWDPQRKIYSDYLPPLKDDPGDDELLLVRPAGGVRGTLGSIALDEDRAALVLLILACFRRIRTYVSLRAILGPLLGRAAAVD